MKQQGSISQAQNSQLSPSVSVNNVNNNSLNQHQLQQQTMQNQMWNNVSAVAHNTSMHVQPQTANNHNNPMAAQIDAINMQQNVLREQIIQSEQNLSAQHGVILLSKDLKAILNVYVLFQQVLLQQQQSQIDESILKAQHETLLKQADENNIRLAEFDAILQPIVDSCTKDSISAGKKFKSRQFFYKCVLHSAISIKRCTSFLIVYMNF